MDHEKAGATQEEKRCQVEEETEFEDDEFDDDLEDEDLEEQDELEESDRS